MAEPRRSGRRIGAANLRWPDLEVGFPLEASAEGSAASLPKIGRERTSRSLAGCLVVLAGWLVPTAAAAHGSVPGVGAFYAGLLHTLLVPEELLLLASCGLMLGSLGQHASRTGLASLSIGLTLGLVMSEIAMVPAQTTSVLLIGTTTLAALAVALAVRMPRLPLVVVLLCGGVALGLDAAPDMLRLPDRLVAAAATIVSASTFAAMAAAAVFGLNGRLARLAYRIAGSWLAAIGILYFGWLIAT